MSKRDLEIELSKLKDYTNKHPSLEQYSTPCVNASELLWTAYMNEDIEGKIIVDAGCGNGILGIGALLLGAKKVIFIDIDKNAIDTTRINLEKLGLENYELINSNLMDVNLTCDLVISNPPFGVQKSNNDTFFIKKISQIAKEIYLIYKGDGLKILKKELPNKNFDLIKKCDMIIKKQFSFHTKDKMKTKIILVKIS